MTGASLGGYAGLLIKKHYIPSVHPSDFALIGAAAFLAGSQRNIVSLCVILMEGTGNTKALIPVIITVVCARSVGDFLSDGVYEGLMELREYPFLKHDAKPQYDVFTAGDVMSTAATVGTLPDAGFIENLIMTTPHNAFPVVDERSGHYQGMIRRDQLIAALEYKMYANIADANNKSEKNNSTFEDDRSILMNRALHIDDDMYRSFTFKRPTKGFLNSNGGLNNEMAMLKRADGNIAISIPPSERLFHVDVSSIMNKCAISVHEDSPLSKVFDVFSR